MGVPIRLYYGSDAESHWNFNDNYKKNIQALHFDEKSVIIRTVWQGYYSPYKVKFHWQRPARGIYWHYLVIGSLYYQCRIGLPDVVNIDDFKSERLPTHHFDLSTIRLPDGL